DLALTPVSHPSTHTARPAGVGSFFRYHGIWAPGIRLFRAVGFRAKALVISSVFAIPLALVSFNYYSQQMEQIAFSAKERDGLVYAREALAMLDAAIALRTAAATGETGSAETAALKQRLASLQAVHQRLGADLSAGPQFDAVRKAMTAIDGARKSAASHVALTDALLALVGQVTDGSNLALDPDLDTY